MGRSMGFCPVGEQAMIRYLSAAIFTFCLFIPVSNASTETDRVRQRFECSAAGAQAGLFAVDKDKAKGGPAINAYNRDLSS